ncbi:MAG: tRNA(fMet)-specific endonuclease VapC, partial [Acidobacteriota bacterium]|nr:tRNA(fMet)-specific endonuclease VapC [Acidobacteriota bacterium]
NKSIVEKIETLEEVYIPVTVIGELYFGAFKSQKIEKNLESISNLLDTANVLDDNAETAKVYGEIKNNLKKKGKPIPENDIWIAAIARYNALTLLTNDEHFKEISDLTVEFLRGAD